MGQAPDRSWTLHHSNIPDGWYAPANILGFRFGTNDYSMIPYWFVLLLAAVVGTVPWIRFIFSLRTMLIAVTAIAALLGLARLATFTSERLWLSCYVAVAALTIWGMTLFVRVLERRKE